MYIQIRVYTDINNVCMRNNNISNATIFHLKIIYLSDSTEHIHHHYNYTMYSSPSLRLICLAPVRESKFMRSIHYIV